MNKLEEKEYISKKIITISIISIFITGFIIRLFYFPHGVPLSLDGISYFSYALDLSQNGKFPINYDLVNNGWPTFFSSFFYFLKFENFLDYMNTQRVISMMLSCITIIPLYVLTRKFFSPILGLIAISLFIFEPRVISNSLYGITEPLYVLLGVICLALFFSGKKWIYVSFVVLGLISIVRYEGLIFLIPLSIMYFVKFRKENRKIFRYVLCVGILALVILPMATIRVETMGTDGFVSHYIATDQGSVLTVINEKVVQGLPDDDEFPGEEGTNRLPEFIGVGISKTIVNLGLIHIPVYVFFIPIATFFILKNQKFKKLNYTHVTLILVFIFGLLPILYAHGRLISDLRYYLILYPIIILISMYGIEKFQNKIELKKIIVPLLISIIVLSVGFMEYSKSNMQLERESFEITKKAVLMSNTLNGDSLHGSYITTAGIVQDWPELKKPIDVKKSKISTEGYGNLREFIIKNEENGLDYLVVDDIGNGPKYIQEIFNNEKLYPYLEKVFDSKESGYNYHVKIFKINYGMIENGG